MPEWERPCIFKLCPVELHNHHIDSGWQGQMWHICCDILLYHQCVARGDSCPSPDAFSAAGQHNDARMNLAIALTAARYGAATANYMEVVSLLKKTDPETGKERVCGARCKDVLTGTPSLCQGRMSQRLALLIQWLNCNFSVTCLSFEAGFRVILIIFLIVNNDWFNMKIFPCGTWAIFTLCVKY